MAGINRAKELKNRVTAKLESYSIESIEPILDSISESRNSNPCIFLSHSSKDKDAVREIGEYIRKNGDIDIYLDEEDAELQSAVEQSDPHRVTKAIERGILASTHLMCFVSENTKDSWWFPYEIGFAKKSLKSEKNLVIIKLKHTYLPHYLQIVKTIEKIETLNLYLESIKKRHIFETSAMFLDHLVSHKAPNGHVLNAYLE